MTAITEEPKLPGTGDSTPLASGKSSAIIPFPGANLTIWQRYFCKPVDRDSEKVYDADNRRFSVLSKGFIISLILSMLMLSVILVPVLVIFTHHNHPLEDHHHGNGGSNSNSGSYGGGNGTGVTAGVPFNQSIAGPINRAVDFNFPDPFVIQVNGTWYAFATNNAVGLLNAPNNATANANYHDNVQIATSQNFVNWTVLDATENVLPTVGAWAVQGAISTAPYTPGAAVWAPTAFQRPSDNKWVLYYSAKDGSSKNSHCIGASVSSSDSILGPYVPVDTSFACPIKQGGAIDPASFIDDDGSVYIAYKVDGNNKGNGGACGNTVAPIHSTPIMLQKVEDDGVTPDGNAIQILDRTNADGPLVEAPSLAKVNGTYFLFFSSGCTRDPSYTVKYAWSSTIDGPYTRANHDLLQSGNWSLSAPGSCSVAQDANGHWGIAFHARVSTPQGGAREMFTAGLNFNGTAVTIVNYTNETRS